MKHWLLMLILALCTSLCACARIVPTEYVSVKPHSDDASSVQEHDAARAENFSELKRAIRGFVQDGAENGIVRIYTYDGDVEEDLTLAAYQVSREDALGAYAVDYMTHRVTRFISYYEIEFDITFRRTKQQLERIEYVPFAASLRTQQQVEAALERHDAQLALHVARYAEHDYLPLVRAYYDNHADTMMAMPDLRVATYPETGDTRIVELGFTYPASVQEISRMRQDVTDTLDAAEVYVRYRENEFERANLLFTYLLGRFTYQKGESDTPMYAFLCEGVATSEGAAKGWQELCDRSGITCLTVHGVRGGEEYWWNIIELGGRWQHVDILRDVLETKMLTARYDSDMGNYYWDGEDLPACPAPPAPEPPPAPEVPAEEVAQTEEQVPGQSETE